MQPDFSIIVLGYKRLYSLQRLLKSLLDAAIAFEKTHPLDLIISLDEGADKEVINFSKNFFSRHFNITVIVHETNLGPDKHNLWAMAQSETYGTVIVLEDDTMVSPSLFYYALESLKFYNANAQVAGISLYNYERNETCNYPFIKLKEGSDTYFYQKASSRGLMITKEQWLRFKNSKVKQTEIDLPQVYKNWSDNVWEKQFNTYLIREQKYWVHPHVSLTTNFGEIGVHVNKKIWRNAFQSNMQQGFQTCYHFKDLESNNAVYDAYGEAVKVAGFKTSEITCDIFGVRDISKITTKYVLTLRHCTENIEGYALDLLPAELNVTHNLRGTDLKVTEPKFIHENYLQKQRRLLRLHYYFYPDKGLLHLLRLKIAEIIGRVARDKA